MQIPNSHQIETAQILLKQANESAKLVNTTKSPSVFFGRLSFLLDVLLELQKYERFGLFLGSSPTNDYNNLLRNLEKTVDNFLDRANQDNFKKIYSLKTPSAKERNRQKFISDLLYAFSASNSFWQGNSVYPHYTGPLYTPSNYDHVGRIAKSQIDHLSLPSTPKTTNKKVTTSFIEKECAIVKMTTDSHMQHLTGFPFVWNEKIKKHIKPHSHSFCYMDITGPNIFAVQNELTTLNLYIQNDCQIQKLPMLLFIPVTHLLFNPQDVQGYTRFVCSPITEDGSFSSSPVTLTFTTPMYSYENGICKPLRNTTHGEVVYGSDGTIKKANVYFWRNGISYFFYYKTIDGVFQLTKFVSSHPNY